ncbi:peptidylprolyl isomerase [Temperatibacter marinus]|uniref:Peptidyl-prolyl cis-trans isomerase n=1 Tax=Temperatibacter marinus TaxID=1456591 RepID=A0AA52EH85_9PROT|nr:peptidylprolyl isomerase [Temperatibacter marinus]WND02264.1 peptidylprolyl isomerase [Temperatibacter marinus]
MYKIVIVLLSIIVCNTCVVARDISFLDAANILVITVETPQQDGSKVTGRVAILMRPDIAPNHVKRVKELARQSFYDGHVFHRVIPGFMAQTGDPTGTGTGGSGQNIKPEFTRTPYLRGTAGMARGEAEDTADSQFFITFTRRADLDMKYTVWGRVIAGMQTVDMIPKGEPPIVPGKMVSVSVASDLKDWESLSKDFK